MAKTSFHRDERVIKNGFNTDIELLLKMTDNAEWSISLSCSQAAHSLSANTSMFSGKTDNQLTSQTLSILFKIITTLFLKTIIYVMLSDYFAFYTNFEPKLQYVFCTSVHVKSVIV